MNEETKKKISQALKGRPTSEQHRQNLSKALRGNKNCLGRTHSEETKKKISDTECGKVVSDETRLKQREAKLQNPVRFWKGKTREQNTRVKISQSLVGRYVGENSPSWKGGLSFEPYGLEFTESLREAVRIRDGRTCQLCLTPENGRKHDCHHIDYDKLNNVMWNLITLCQRCHRKTHHNRNYWISFFKELQDVI